MDEIVCWGTPIYRCVAKKKNIIGAWIKITGNCLLDLRKDIKVRNLPKITPISFSGQIKRLIDPLCNVNILPILPHLDPTLPRSLQRDDLRDRVKSVV